MIEYIKLFFGVLILTLTFRQAIADSRKLGQRQE